MKESIDIPIACFKCRKYGHHATECEKKEKAKKEKDKKEMTKMKQDGVDIGGVWAPCPRFLFFFFFFCPHLLILGDRFYCCEQCMYCSHTVHILFTY